MMQKIFISYGSGGYLKSLRSIGKEARELGIFAKIILYTEKDLPPFIQASPLRAYSRGNGYWVWKPYIIWKTLQDYPNSIVVYSDSGCILQKNLEEWNSWFMLLENYDTLAFQYRSDYEYLWQQYLGCRTTIREWTKKSLIEYFSSMINNSEWIDSEQILSGIVLACRHSSIIKMWLDITLMHPELIIDSFGRERDKEDVHFIEHRHDQSLWTALCMYWKEKGTVVKVLQETAESDPHAAIVAARRRIIKNPIPLKTRMIQSLKAFWGEKNYLMIHDLLGNRRFVKKIILWIEHRGAISSK